MNLNIFEVWVHILVVSATCYCLQPRSTVWHLRQQQLWWLDWSCNAICFHIFSVVYAKTSNASLFAPPFIHRYIYTYIHTHINNGTPTFIYTHICIHMLNTHKCMLVIVSYDCAVVLCYFRFLRGNCNVTRDRSYHIEKFIFIFISYSRATRDCCLSFYLLLLFLKTLFFSCWQRSLAFALQICKKTCNEMYFCCSHQLHHLAT